MKTLTTSPDSGRSFLFMLLFMCWCSLQTLQAQTIYDTYHEMPEYSHLLEAGVDLGLGMNEIPIMSRSGEYLVKLDTFKHYSPRDGQTILTSMTVYTFDENNRIAETNAFSIQPNVGFIQVNVYKPFYDESGLLVSDTFHILNPNTLIWRPVNYSDYEYNQDGIRIKRTTHLWDVSLAEWYYSSKTEMEIEDGLKVSETSYLWDRPLQVFNLNSYTTWEYEDELLVDHKFHRVDTSDGSYFVFFRNYYEYNANRQMSIKEFYNRQNENNQLRPVNRSEFFYNDDFGKAATVLVSDWLHDADDWEPSKRTENTYDHYYNLLNSLDYLFNINNPGDWVLDRDIEYEINYDFDSGTYLTGPIHVDVSSHMITKITTSLVNPSRPGFRQEFIYSDLSVNTVELVTESNFYLYPNPVQDMLSIRLEEYVIANQKITVVDIGGRIVYQNDFNGFLEIATNQWPAGIYTVVLQEQNGASVFSRQFVKQ